MAKKKEEAKKTLSAEEKAAKKKARMEALKNRPDGQRTNSKQIDVIKFGENSEIQNFGYTVKSGSDHVGVLVTSVVVVDGKPISTSVSFVNGKLTVKSKKGHGVIAKPKKKGDNSEAEENAED